MQNKTLREEIIKKLNLDVICLSETHFKHEDVVETDGYFCVTNNRKLRKRAPKGSGGVTVLIKEDILRGYSVDVMNKDYDGILGVQLQNKVTDLTSVIFSCYLSPEYSICCRNADETFTQLTVDITRCLW